MKKSELIARYRHFGKELISVNQREFFKALKERTIYQNMIKLDEESDCVTFGIDGWDFFCYSSCYNVGWEGDVNSDSFFFKIQRMTDQDRTIMKKIFSRENDYTVLDDHSIQGDDFKFDELTAL